MIWFYVYLVDTAQLVYRKLRRTFTMSEAIKQSTVVLCIASQPLSIVMQEARRKPVMPHDAKSLMCIACKIFMRSADHPSTHSPLANKLYMSKTHVFSL